VEIPFDKGLKGWSDGDVLTHAIMDALLGAAALGNIGTNFPPGESQYKNISSLTLLKKVKGLLTEHGWKVGNIDATVVAEQPKLKDYIDSMRQKLSQTIGIELGRVSVKATTSEKIGFIGQGEAIAVYSVALIEGSNDENI
jgi:2-C-methyl-D-erythritol 2,4-cyclodiphosphate synthase